MQLTVAHHQIYNGYLMKTVTPRAVANIAHNGAVRTGARRCSRRPGVAIMGAILRCTMSHRDGEENPFFMTGNDDA